MNEADFIAKMIQGKEIKKQKTAELVAKVKGDQMTRDQAAQELLEKMSELGMAQSLRYCRLVIDQQVKGSDFGGLKLGRHI